MGPSAVIGDEGIVGVLRDRSGRAVAGVVIGAMGRDVGRRAATTTNSAGFFRIDSLEPGDYNLWVADTRYRSFGAVVHVRAGRAEVVDLLTLPDGEFGLAAHQSPPRAGSEGPKIPLGPRAAGGLSLEIRRPFAVFAVGEPVRLFASFRNKGPDPVVVVRAVDKSLFKSLFDKSMFGWRDPSYTVRVAGPVEDAEPPRRTPFIGCGNQNPLYRGDVVEVPPGGAVDPFAKADEYHFREGSVLVSEFFDLAQPGTYRAWIEYSYRSVGVPPLRECVYERPGVRPRDPCADARALGLLHTPAPALPPLVVDGLTSNVVEFSVSSDMNAVLRPRPTRAAFSLEMGSIEVKVVDPRGRPHRNAEVMVAGSGRPMQAVGPGVFRQDGMLPGRYDIRVTVARGERIKPKTVGVRSRSMAELVFQEPGFGRVRLDFGDANAEARAWDVRVYEGSVPMPLTYSQLRERRGRFYVPHSGATTEYRKIPVGAYTLFIQGYRAGKEFVIRQEIVVEPGETTDVQVARSELPVLPEALP